MSIGYTFEFWKLNIIDSKKDEVVPFKAIFDMLEKKPLKVSDSNNRYFCHNQLCYRAVSDIQRVANGKIITFSKYENKNINGGFLENGEYEFDAIEELKKAIQRDDVAIKEYNRAKIYSNGIVIFQTNKKANTMNHLKCYLEHHTNNQYQIEILPIYKNELFLELEKGIIDEINLYVGFAPDGGFDGFQPESYSGAIKAELRLKREKDGFLKSTYLKTVLMTKKLTGFGSLDGGTVTNAKAFIVNNETKKKVLVSLDSYHLKERKEFSSPASFHANPNDTFEKLYKDYKSFLDEYAKRDERYS